MSYKLIEQLGGAALPIRTIGPPLEVESSVRIYTLAQITPSQRLSLLAKNDMLRRSAAANLGSLSRAIPTCCRTLRRFANMAKPGPKGPAG